MCVERNTQCAQHYFPPFHKFKCIFFCYEMLSSHALFHNNMMYFVKGRKCILAPGNGQGVRVLTP